MNININKAWFKKHVAPVVLAGTTILTTLVTGCSSKDNIYENSYVAYIFTPGADICNDIVRFEGYCSGIDKNGQEVTCEIYESVINDVSYTTTDYIDGNIQVSEPVIGTIVNNVPLTYFMTDEEVSKSLSGTLTEEEMENVISRIELLHNEKGYIPKNL